MDKKKESEKYLDMSYDTDSDEECLKYTRKALKIDKNNIEAGAHLIDLTEDNLFKKLDKYEKLEKKAEKILRDKGYFEKYTGHFYFDKPDTIPYMRVREKIMKLYIELGMYTKAIDVGFDLLRLNPSDDMEIRYHLIGICVLLEKNDLANKLFKEYKENTTLMLIPKLVMYYKKKDFKNLDEGLPILNKLNSHVIEIIKGTEVSINAIIHTPGELDEASIAFDIYSPLLQSTMGFIYYLSDNM